MAFGEERDERGISRRRFLVLAGCAPLASAACAPLRLGVDGQISSFDHEVDVVVVGTGAAGATAALFAHEGGAGTLVLEKAFLFGGTTAKSGGVFWIPGSRFEREEGLVESREETLSSLARACYPQLFDPTAARNGVPEAEWALLETLYDEGPQVVDELERLGALSSLSAKVMVGPMSEYYTTGEGETHVDRRLGTRTPDGGFGYGNEMVRQLKQALAERGIPIWTAHAARRLILGRDDAVVGLEVLARNQQTLRIRARRGVVFGSGGFVHNAQLVRNHQPGPMFGGCAVPTNQGDFVPIAQAVGAQLGHMQSAWRTQIVLEQALQFSSVPDVVFMPPGDSMLLVNKLGRRVVNEKVNYHERSWIHFDWDSHRKEWINQILFMIYDQRSAELYGGNYPVPNPGTTAPYVLQGDTLGELADAIERRLARLAPRTGGFRIAGGFLEELEASVARFNVLAEAGVDEDHRRGVHAYDRDWHLRGYSEPSPRYLEAHPLHPRNPTLHPLRSQGPYYAILLAAGALDTNGGPVVNSRAEVMHVQGRPIPGLYGAGNCIAAPTPFYYAGGGTLAAALTFGAIAGREAARAPLRDLS